MLLRNSISSTKKFFQKTIDNFKSLLTKGSNYERLPKMQQPFACERGGNGVDIEAGCRELDKFYVEFTHQWDNHKSVTKTRAEKRTKKSKEFCSNDRQNEKYIGTARKAEDRMTLRTTNQTHELYCQKHDEAEVVTRNSKENYAERKTSNVSTGMGKSEMCSRNVRERKLNFVAKKMKELELMDKGNVDHKLDIEQILHCYSRLTCPIYLDIVDKFFTEICTEFFGARANSHIR